MNSAGSDAALIGLDWGTSSLQAYLIGGDGELLDQIAAEKGIMQVEGCDFDTTFHDLVRPWIQTKALPVIASGMITSRNGWIETPYLPLPAGARELSAALVPHTTSDGAKLYFVTGTATENDGAPDVMRGEETQIVGIVASGQDQGTFVMPGTHSKWVSLEGGRITGYQTFMTGEVFAALRRYTILGTLMVDGPFSEESFAQGVTSGLSAGADLLHRLFHVRTLPLFDRITPGMVGDYLSGLLIGTEIAAGSKELTVGNAVTIIGRGDLSSRYTLALTQAGIKNRAAPDNIAARGLYQIARLAGLLP